MPTDYRLILLSLLDGQTYTDITTALRCSSKSIAAARKVLTTHHLDTEAVAALGVEELQRLFPDERRGRDDSFAPVDCDAIVTRLRGDRDLTIKVEWERYRRDCLTNGLKPYGQSQFYAFLSDYLTVTGLSWPLTHHPGRTMFVDWSGTKMRIGAPGDPDAVAVSVFVATLPHSGLIFARCYIDETSPRWLKAHADACAYVGGVPEVFVPDNASTASYRPAKNDPAREISTPYTQFAQYYGAGIVPTAPAKPTHKAHVERGVGIIQDWVTQYLAPYTYDTLEDLNDAVTEQVEWLNHVKTPYRGISGHTRYQEFVEYEQEFLRPLPQVAWEPVTWRFAVVHPDCHFQVDKHRYSAPYTWARKKVRIGLGENTVAVYSEDGVEHITTHPRNYGRPGSYTTNPDHQPPNTTPFGELWTTGRYETWSAHVGPNTAKAIGIILARPPIVQQAFQTCENILHLGKRYSNRELEQACQHVLSTHAFVGYRAIKDALTDSATHTPPSRTGTPHATMTPPPATAFSQASLRGHTAFTLPVTPQEDTDHTGDHGGVR